MHTTGAKAETFVNWLGGRNVCLIRNHSSRDLIIVFMLFIGPCVRQFTTQQHRTIIERKKKLIGKRELEKEMCKNERSAVRSERFCAILFLSPKPLSVYCHLIILVIHVNNYVKLKIQNSDSSDDDECGMNGGRRAFAGSRDKNNWFNLQNITSCCLFSFNTSNE